MKPKHILPYLFLVFFLAVLYQPAQGATNGWTVIGPGIEYQAFHLADPNNVFVTRMDRSNPNVTIDSSIAGGRLAGTNETVRGMASRYDQAINYWNQDWGGRNHVVVAINGYYFDTTTFQPWRGQVQSGWYAKRFDDYENGSGFAWGLNRNAFVGGCVAHIPANQFITLLKTGDTQKFAGINVPRGDNELVIYTPQYDDSTHADNSGLEVVVEMSRPSLILPEPAMAVGTIQTIRKNKGNTTIPFDSVVLSASGDIAVKLLSFDLQVGDQIGISQEITHYQDDCKTKNSASWTKIYASIGGDYHFLRNGVIDSYPDKPAANTRAPRTGIAFNDAYIFFIVVDGRNPGVSVGMKISELARFARDTLGAVEGVTLDSGGSSTMVVNGAVVNNTTCNFTDCSKNSPAINPGAASGPIHLVSPENSQLEAVWDPQESLYEPWIANGMMMVSVEPRIQSHAFQSGSQVTTRNQTAVRLGPGTNYATLATVPAQTKGTLVQDMNHLDGILAKGAYWWKVDFGGTTGWVNGQALTSDSILLPFILRQDP
jgi:hypothetical protein